MNSTDSLPAAMPQRLPWHVFLSSPGDVTDERGLAREVIDRLQSERAHRDWLQLRIVAWDKPGAGTAMPAHLEPQEALEQGLRKPSECDIVVVIFGYRMGTPLSAKHRKPGPDPRYWSGTEYEYLDALQAARATGAPTVLVYRKEGAPDVNAADPQRQEKLAQWDRVEAFFAGFRNPDGSFQSYYKTYNTPSHFEKLLDADLRDLVAQRRGPQPSPLVTPPSAAGEPEWRDSPYPGLRAFKTEEALIFFGRGRETDELIRRLSDPRNRLVFVAGASGSGKSSLVAAGLLPRLQHDAVPGSQDWVAVRFTPGDVAAGGNALLALAPPLAAQGWTAERLAEALADDPDRLEELVRLRLQGHPDWAELLLFIDQFEELFTLVSPPHQEPFLRVLAAAATTPRVRTVATVRADFVAVGLDRPPLDQLLQAACYLLTAPGVGELHELIVRPAARAGLTFADGLAERLLNDTGTEPGALALLAFALFELYKARTPDGRLTHGAYESFGGVQGAIARRAEQVYKAYQVIYPEAQGTMDAVFRELVEVDERGVATRRRAPRRQVCAAPAAEHWVNAFTDARLLVTTGEGGQRLVEVAHEALLRSWPRLAQWIEAVKDDLRLRHQLSRAAVDWQNHDQAKRFQWSDERAVEAGAALKRLRYEPTDLEQRFLGPVYVEPMLAAIDNSATSHEERATIGVRLALVGDPRPGVGLRGDGLPDIDWRRIEGGEVTLLIRSDPDDPNSAIVKRLTRAVDPFWMARYPVTAAQFQAFLTDCYRDGHWRLPPGFPMNVPDGYPPPKHQARHGNHPADSVNWWDASLFCHWLSTRLDFEVRLPTEYEWQLAATGGDAERTYPWGPDWDPQQEPWRANTIESGLNRSTAVGMYPAGASPAGVLDMAGTVWEWCLNEYEHPERTRLSGEGRRVVRGGSWRRDQILARAASRFVLHSGSRTASWACGWCVRPPLSYWTTEH